MTVRQLATLSRLPTQETVERGPAAGRDCGPAGGRGLEPCATPEIGMSWIKRKIKYTYKSETLRLKLTTKRACQKQDTKKHHMK